MIHEKNWTQKILLHCPFNKRHEWKYEFYENAGNLTVFSCNKNLSPNMIHENKDTKYKSDFEYEQKKSS